MSSVTTPPTAVPTVAAAALMTAAEFVRLYENKYAELVNGQVKETSMPSAKHGKICLRLGSLLFQYAEEKDCAHVMSNDSFVQTRTNPDSVRGPDLCYYSYERLPKGKVPEGLLPVVPELVVEVKSPSDNWSQMFLKVGEYLNAGIRVVIIPDEPTATASVYRAEELQQICHNGDELTVPDVLPGFAVRVSKLFE